MEIKPKGNFISARGTTLRNNIAGDFGSGTVIKANLVQPNTQYMIVGGTVPDISPTEQYYDRHLPHISASSYFPDALNEFDVKTNQIFTTKSVLPADMSAFNNLDVKEVSGATSVLVTNHLNSSGQIYVYIREEGFFLSNVRFTNDLNGTFTCDASKINVNDLVLISGKRSLTESHITAGQAYNADALYKVSSIIDGQAGVNVTKFKLKNRTGSTNLTTTFLGDGSVPSLTFKVVGDVVGAIKVPRNQSFKIIKKSSQTVESSTFTYPFLAGMDNTHVINFTPLAITD